MFNVKLKYMKTKLMVFALLAGFAFSVSAQEYQPQVGYSNESGAKTNFKKNKAGDNWFISLGGAGSVLIADFSFANFSDKATFADHLNFNPQLSVGKWFRPYWGIRVQLTGGPIVGYDYLRVHNDDLLKKFRQKNNYFGAHADFLLDVTNLWAPYSETKGFRLIPWIGLGYAQRFKTGSISDLGAFDPWNTNIPGEARRTDDHSIPRTESPSLNAGILTAFRLNKLLDLNVEVQGSLLNEQFNRVAYHHLSDAIIQASVGLTFKLGKSDFEVIEPTDYGLLNDLNDQINDLRAENRELSKRPVSCPECPRVQPSTSVNRYGENVVYFHLNSTKIEENQQINIYNTAEFLHEHNVPVRVVGYADRKTGSRMYNLALSEKRAKAVARQLIEKYGISPDRVTVEWRGAEVQPFGENSWNRVVIMTVGK